MFSQLAGAKNRCQTRVGKLFWLSAAYRASRRQEVLRKRALKAERQRAWRQRRRSIEAIPRVREAKEGARRL
jgi:hypothetical protein